MAMNIKNKWSWLFFLAGIWFFAGVLITLHEYFFLANYPGVLSTEAMGSFNFINNLIAASAGLFIGGLAFGLLELFYFQRHLKRQKFWITVSKKILIYCISLFFLIVVISLFFNSFLSNTSILDIKAWLKTKRFITSMAFWHPVLPFMILAILSSFFLQLSERFGPNEMWKIFSGKYFNPKEESRIFMFLDLDHSTTIAENLGNQKFYQFLNDFFHDIAKIIIANKGEVVDYIGDLVIISWVYKSGIEESRCLKCFEEFERVITNNRKHYLEKYDVIPTFKAAVHCGKVIIGEMGKIKKSIKFSGDVLNTTSRVEKVCGDRGAKLAVTNDLLAILEDHNFIFEKVSNITLKGKKNPIDVYTAEFGN